MSLFRKPLTGVLAALSWLSALLWLMDSLMNTTINTDLGKTEERLMT